MREGEGACTLLSGHQRAPLAQPAHSWAPGKEGGLSSNPSPAAPHTPTQPTAALGDTQAHSHMRGRRYGDIRGHPLSLTLSHSHAHTHTHTPCSLSPQAKPLCRGVSIQGAFAMNVNRTITMSPHTLGAG